MVNKSIMIADITCRDGAQSSCANIKAEEKLRIAEQLIKLNVPIIEAGFPIASDDDFKGVKLIAEEFGEIVTVCAMCRAVKKDIECAAKALGNVSKRRIQVVMGTSDIHLKHKFNMNRNEARALSAEMVNYASEFTDDVEFAAEDATRSDIVYLIRVVRDCISAGASTIELPDTVGYSMPKEYYALIKQIVNVVHCSVKVSAHAHNDLGMAVPNTLAAILAGARQIETTINGYGERCGNASLEQIILNIKTRKDFFGEYYFPGINNQEIMNTCKLVADIFGQALPHHQPLTGKGAFSHESGIHQDGLIKSPQTYQIITPFDFGIKENPQFVLGKLSGKRALEQKVKELGYDLTEEQIKEFSLHFKEFASDTKEQIDDLTVEQLLLTKFPNVKVID